MIKSTSAHAAVNDYFRLLPGRDVASVVRLFADDAVILPAPMPETGPVRGTAAITALYQGWFKVAMRFLELRMYDDGRSCAAEARVAIGDEGRIMEVVDIFDLDRDGRITRMSVYKR